MRHQYHHSADVAATILDVRGLEMPATYRGVEQYPMNGISMRCSFDADPNGPTQREHQYYEMMGTRGIWEDGWHAATNQALGDTILGVMKTVSATRSPVSLLLPSSYNKEISE